MKMRSMKLRCLRIRVWIPQTHEIDAIDPQKTDSFSCCGNSAVARFALREAPTPKTNDRSTHANSYRNPCRRDIAESSCRSFRFSFRSVVLKQRQPAFAVGRTSARPVNHRRSSSWFNPQVWDSAPPQRTYQPNRCLHRGRKGTGHQAKVPRSRRIGRELESFLSSRRRLPCS